MDLSDITKDDFELGSFLKGSVEIRSRTDEDKIRLILVGRLSHNAPGPDDILNAFLKAMGQPLIRAVVTLINSC